MIGVMPLWADRLTTTPEAGRRQGRILPQGFQRACGAVHTFILDFGLLGCGTMRRQVSTVFRPLSYGSRGKLTRHLLVFFSQLEIVLILGTMSAFQLKAQHLGYEVRRLRSLFKPSVSPGFP